ncbi:MAG: hypothetical protein ACFB21_02295 [Opitutales bacterium]
MTPIPQPRRRLWPATVTPTAAPPAAVASNAAPPTAVASNATPPASHDFACPLPPGQQWFSPQEAADCLGASAQYFRNLCDSGEVFAHLLRAPEKRGRSRENARTRYRIPRAALLLHLATTANYTPEQLLHELSDVLRQRPPEERRWLREQL